MARFEMEFRVVVLDEPLTLYRACHGPDRRALERALMSNFQARREPPHPADLHAAVLHMAVSMFEQRENLERMARRRPDRIGTHIATLALEPGYGVCIADTGGAGHWSVWGVPAQLMAFVTDAQTVG
jgi:hypothetical protein